MNKLPKEIFIQITSYLSTFDKLKCILVCKLWRHTLSLSNLYENIEFKRVNTFQQASTLFTNGQDLGKRVNSLKITHLDLYLKLQLLSELFPNLKHLSWIDYNNSVNTRHLHHAPGKWKRLQQIDETITLFSISTYLLEFNSFNNLKNINICFRTIRSSDNAPTVQLCKELVNHIHNAPSLEQLILSYAVICLIDLEKIHAGATRLKRIALISVTPPEQEERITVNQTANYLESFQFYYNPVAAGMSRAGSVRVDNTMATWLTYFSQKYKSAYEIKVVYDIPFLHGTLHAAQFFEQPIMDIFSNLPNIISYEINNCPLTQRITKLMQRKNIRLKKVQLWIRHNEQIRQDFSIIRCCSQVDSIQNLTITQWNRHNLRDTSMLNVYLIDLCSAITHLVYLKIEGIIGGGVNLLIAILQNLATIETLSISLLEYKSGDDRYNIDDMKKSKIKNLQVHVECHFEESHLMPQVNKTFYYFLQSCPYLEEISISGILDGRSISVFDLNFFDHHLLKFVHIHIYGCKYYTFSDRGSRWKDYNQISVNMYGPARFHINLACKGNVKMDLMNV